MATNFNWNRLERTPEGALSKSEAQLSISELAGRFEKQTDRDLEVGNIWNELVREITNNIAELLRNDDGAEVAAGKIVDQFQSFLKNEKGLDDRRQQVAYVISVGKSIEKKRGSIH